MLVQFQNQRSRSNIDVLGFFFIKFISSGKGINAASIKVVSSV